MEASCLGNLEYHTLILFSVKGAIMNKSLYFFLPGYLKAQLWVALPLTTLNSTPGLSSVTLKVAAFLSPFGPKPQSPEPPNPRTHKPESLAQRSYSLLHLAFLNCPQAHFFFIFFRRALHSIWPLSKVVTSVSPELLADQVGDSGKPVIALSLGLP